MPENEPAPRISLVIPAYDEEKYIRPTLESVTRAKAKYEASTGRRVEIIVVDNASTDRTADIAREFGCTIVPFNKHQIAAVRNAGAREARGELIAFVDADKSLVPEGAFLEIDRNLSDEHIYGGGSAFTAERWSVSIWLFALFFRVWCRISGLGYVLFYLRKRDFDALGGWNEEMYIAEDVDLAFRMRRAAKASGRELRNLSEPVCVCTRKAKMLPPLRTLWRALKILIRRDFGNPEAAHFLFYDIDKLR